MRPEGLVSPAGGVSRARRAGLGSRVGRPRRRPHRRTGAGGPRRRRRPRCWSRPTVRSGTAGSALVTGDWALFRPGPDPAGPGTALGCRGGPSWSAARPARRPARQVLAANVDLVFVLVSLAAPPQRRPAGPAAHRRLGLRRQSGRRADQGRPGRGHRGGRAGRGRRDRRAGAGAADQHGRRPRAGRAARRCWVRARPPRCSASPAPASPASATRSARAPARVAPVGPTGKGRHTTTARELVGLPGGGLLLDTPGLRGVQLWAADEGLDIAFADIVELAEQCRFRDCRHAGEPGCAIAAAVAAGTVSARRVASHAALRHEVGWLRDRYDARQRAEQRRQWKQLSKAVRAGRKASPRHGDRPR